MAGSLWDVSYCRHDDSVGLSKCRETKNYWSLVIRRKEKSLHNHYDKNQNSDQQKNPIAQQWDFYYTKE